MKLFSTSNRPYWAPALRYLSAQLPPASLRHDRPESRSSRRNSASTAALRTGRSSWQLWTYAPHASAAVRRFATRRRIPLATATHADSELGAIPAALVGVYVSTEPLLEPAPCAGAKRGPIGSQAGQLVVASPPRARPELDTSSTYRPPRLLRIPSYGISRSRCHPADRPVRTCRRPSPAPPTAKRSAERGRRDSQSLCLCDGPGAR